VVRWRGLRIADDLPAGRGFGLYEFKMLELQTPGRLGGSTAVTVTTIAPSVELAPYLRRFEIVETGAPISRVLMPEPGLILGVRYAGASNVDGFPAPMAPAVLTGFRMKARGMATGSGGGVVVAKFTETGAAAFLDVPLHHLFGAILPLEELLPAPSVEQLVEAVRRASTAGERVAVVERFVRSRLRPRPDPVVVRAARTLRESREIARIAPLARDLGVSQDALEKRFRRQVGATPKQFASIVRFRRALALRRPGRDLGEVALEAGYYDQAHFSRDFRAVTGTAPGTLLSSDAYDPVS
jgi:AraC-like DNA-binding protein